MTLHPFIHNNVKWRIYTSYNHCTNHLISVLLGQTIRWISVELSHSHNSLVQSPYVCTRCLRTTTSIQTIHDTHCVIHVCGTRHSLRLQPR